MTTAAAHSRLPAGFPDQIVIALKWPALGRNRRGNGRPCYPTAMMRDRIDPSGTGSSRQPEALAARADFGRLACAVILLAGAPAKAEPRHGIAMHGEPALPRRLQGPALCQPGRAQGRAHRFGVQGTFDTLNSYSVRGIAAQGVSPPMGLVFQSLMARSWDEPFSLYGQIATSIETPDDRSWVQFRLDPRARFSDGSPVTSEDVLFTWDLLKQKGKPSFRSWYAKAVKVETPDAHTIRFDLTGADDRELPLILALMPVFSKNAMDPARFEETNLSVPIGTGPYVVSEVKPGESITFKRIPDWWGDQLPVARGLYNPDEIRYDYYRDANALFEAFKGGLYECGSEDSPSRWTSQYDFPAVQRWTRGARPRGRAHAQGHERLRVQHAPAVVLRHPRPGGAGVAVRFPLGQPEPVRRRLQAHRQLLRRIGPRLDGPAGARQGTGAPGPLPRRGSRGRAGGPLDARERRRLGPGPGAGAQGLKLLGEAGWSLKDGALRNAEGEPFAFEFLAATRVQERLALNFGQTCSDSGSR